jgi:hypothetical protein
MNLIILDMGELRNKTSYCDRMSLCFQRRISNPPIKETADIRIDSRRTEEERVLPLLRLLSRTQ